MPRLNLELLQAAVVPPAAVKKAGKAKRLPKEPKKYVEEYKKRNRSKIHGRDYEDAWDVEERSEAFVPDMRIETPKEEPDFDLFRGKRKGPKVASKQQASGLTTSLVSEDMPFAKKVATLASEEMPFRPGVETDKTS